MWRHTRLEEIRDMFYLKSCRKCHGDMYKDKDSFGAYLQCIQCGFMYDLPKESSAASQAEELASTQKQIVA